MFPAGAQSEMWAGSMRCCKLVIRLPAEASSVGASAAGNEADISPGSQDTLQLCSRAHSCLIMCLSPPRDHQSLQEKADQPPSVSEVAVDF